MLPQLEPSIMLMCVCAGSFVFRVNGVSVYVCVHIYVLLKTCEGV